MSEAQIDVARISQHGFHVTLHYGTRIKLLAAHKTLLQKFKQAGLPMWSPAACIFRRKIKQNLYPAYYCVFEGRLKTA